MFLDKYLFDELDLSLIKSKIMSRRQIIGMNITRFLFVPKIKCKICNKRIKRKQIIFIPQYGSVHSGNCFKTYIKNIKERG